MPHGRKKKSKKSKQKLILFENADKKFHEKWEAGDDMLNVPHPFRISVCGTCNCGKSTVVKNIIVHQQPIFQEIYLYHCDGDTTKEYDDINVIVLNELPSQHDWNIDKKKLLIIDDVSLKGMDKQQLSYLDRAFGYVSTHKNLSICNCTQDLTNFPPPIRRMCNFYILWRIRDVYALTMVGKKCGMTKENIQYIMNEYLKGSHDSLWIDCTNDTPYPFRINGYDLISPDEFDFPKKKIKKSKERKDDESS